MPLESKKRVTKLVQLLKHKWRISNAALRSLSRAPKWDAADGDYESDAETFLSADSCDLRSISSTDNSSAEFPSLRLSGLIFPTGILQRPPPASPVKIVKKLPFGYVIGRQLDAPVAPKPELARSVKKMMAQLHIRSRSQMVKNKVARALKGTLRRARRGAAVEEVDGGNDDEEDEDVFWKRSVRGLRCRRLEEEDDDAPY